MHFQRSILSCTKYLFIAQSSGKDWDNQLYILNIDYHTFFDNVLLWIERRDADLELLSDDLIVSKHEPPNEISFAGEELKSSLSFYCQLEGKDSHQKINWFDELLAVFTEYLENNGYETNNVGPYKQPLFTVTTLETLYRPKQEIYLFRVTPTESQGKSLDFCMSLSAMPEEQWDTQKSQLLISFGLACFVRPMTLCNQLRLTLVEKAQPLYGSLESLKRIIMAQSYNPQSYHGDS